MSKSYYIKDIHNYEMCPARYMFERKRRKGAAYTKFEVFQLLFKTYFRMMALERNNTSKMHHLVQEYKHVLFPNGENLSSEVMVAYSIKCFEKLYYDIVAQGTYFLPDTFLVEFEDWDIAMPCDLIYTGFTERNHHAWEITFVYLVPNDRWNTIDLANRFEIFLTQHYIAPQLKKTKDTRTSIIFLNYENGKQCKIGSGNMGSTAGFKSRLRNVLTGMSDKTYGKRPVNALCSACPHIEACNPFHKYKLQEVVAITDIK